MRSAVVRFALLLAVAVAVVAVWMLVLDGDEEQEDVSAPTHLYTVPQDEIISVTVRTETATVAFERGNEGWRFADAPLVPVNLDRWGGIVLLLSGPEVERLLAPPSNLDQFGLDSPSAISIGLIDGRQVEVRLGAETPDGRNVYVQLEGESGVALVNEPWVRVLLRLAADPPLPYWYYRVDPALVRIFEVESPDGIATFLLGLLRTDGGLSARVVQGEVASGLTDAEHTAVLNVTGGPSSFGIATWPEGFSPTSVSLDVPRAIVRVTYELAVPLEDKSAVSAAYAVGAQTADGKAYYAVTPDSPLLLTVDAVWVDEVLSLVGRKFEGSE